MRLRDLLYLASLNLNRMKLRVLMTAAGVLIGTAALVLLVSLGVGLQRATQRSLGNIGDLTLLTLMPGEQMVTIGGAPTSGPKARLTQDALERIKKMPEVVAVTPLVSLDVPVRLRIGHLEGSAAVMGIDPRSLRALGLKVKEGRLQLSRTKVLAGGMVPEQLRDRRRPRARLSEEEKRIAGHPAVLELFSASGPPVPLGPGPVILEETPDRARPSKKLHVLIAGVLEPSGSLFDAQIILPLDEVIRLRRELTKAKVDFRREGYPRALVKVKDVKVASQVERKLVQEGYLVFSPRAMLRGLNMFFLIIQAILGGISAVALLVAAFGIANTMVMSIYERTREIGLMKAMGALNRDILLLFLAESGIIGLLGGLGGVVLGWVLGWVGDNLARAYMLRSMVMQTGRVQQDAVTSFVYTPVWLILSALLFAVLVGILAGIYPAMRAANLDPIQALRYE